jgi:hypothetical protein
VADTALDRQQMTGKHSGDEYRRMAERCTILRCQVGSGVHGTAIEGHDDRDEMGICTEPPEYVIGLRRFEQYIYRTQADRWLIRAYQMAWEDSRG